MNTRRTIVVLGIIIAVGFAAGVLALPSLPERIPSHWNASGEVDGYSSAQFGALFLPGVLIVVASLLMVVPLIDPLRANIAAFRPQYNLMVVGIAVFFLYMHFLILAAALGKEISMNVALAPAFGGLFFFLGFLMRYARRNWIMGIRTPWTLSSDRVWDKTHALGAVLFQVGGVMIALCMLVPGYLVMGVLGVALGATLWLVVYSYWEYRKGEREKNN